MRVKAIGVMRMKGIGKQSGQPYDFAQLMYLRPVEVFTKDNLSITGIGYEVSKLDLQIEAMHKFNDIKFPADLDITLEQIPDRRGIRSVVSGFTAQQVPVRVA